MGMRTREELEGRRGKRRRRRRWEEMKEE